ncbi:MAG: carboxypeptidase regulatory-like domain-containing protein [Promethearchaeota archaeon]
MLKNRNKLDSLFAIIIFGILFVSNIFLVNASFPIKEANELTLEGKEIDDNDEMLIPPTYKRSLIDWRPIEESLDFSGSNSESTGDPTITASYDALTGEESTFFDQEFMPSSSVIESYEGILAEADSNLAEYGDNSGDVESVIGSDGRVRITPTTSYPWRTIVKLYITAADSSLWVGSGAMIDAFHVLTAGHCAYLHDNGGWASSIEVVPAMDNLDDPIGNAWMTFMRSYTGWTADENPGHDWAVLTLDRNIGSYTGWMGRITAGSSSYIYDQTMNVAGYPTDLDGGDNMYWDSDSGDGATSLNHYYWADTYGGMSGGPVWRYVEGSRYIMTVHAYGREGTDSNYGTRLNQDKFDRIPTWLSADSAPTDYADLEDRGSAYSGYNLGTVYEGQNYEVWCDIINKGTASSGTFTVSFYASTNAQITTGDYFLGSDVVSSISPFNYRDSMWSGAFPSIPNGQYYIGWIIDSGGTVSEFDEGDNTGYISTRITKIDRPPGGYIEVTARDLDTSLPLQSAYVRCWDPSDTLVSWGYTDSSGFFNITGLMDIGYYTINVTKSGYNEQTIENYINFAGDDDYVTIYLEPYPPNSGYIDVTVKDSDTLAYIPYAFVECYYLNGTRFSYGYADSSGFYKITGLAIGSWEVKVSKGGYIEQSKYDYIDWNGDDDYLTFYLAPYPPNSGYIEVRVNDSISYNPIQNALVECFYPNGTLFDSGYTNSLGEFNITGLAIGSWTVNVSKTGYITQTRQNYINWNGDDDYLYYYLTIGDSDVGFTEVNVFDNVSSNPIQSALVQCFFPNGTLFDSGYTNSQGFYIIANLTIGWWTINVSKITYYIQSQQNEISAGGEFDTLIFNLDPLPEDSGYIEVQANDSSTYDPIENAYVACYYLNGTLFSTGYTDSSGFYKITGLVVGWWFIEVSKIGYDLETSYDYINWIGDDDYLYFYLDTIPIKQAFIEVYVYDNKTLNPISNAYVRCYNDTSGDLLDSGYTDSSGFFNFTGLEIGWYKIIASYPGYDPHEQLDYINWYAAEHYLDFYLNTKFLPITGPVAIFRDSIPWGYNVTEPILIKYGISYSIYNSTQFGAIDLSSYQKVIIASMQPQTFYDRLVGNVTWFENYASNGGILEVHACDSNVGSHWYGLLLMPGGLNKSQVYINNVSINLPMHPLLNSPYLVEDDELDDWSASTHGIFTNVPPEAKKILVNGTTSDAVLIEFPFGSGHILATMQTIEWNDGHNYTRLLENMILYNPFLYEDSINVTTPDNSSIWEVYSSYNIIWTSTGSIDNVRIELWNNGAFEMEIVDNTPNDGDFSWDIPEGLVDSTLYQIKVMDADYPTTYDICEEFEVFNPSITIISPKNTSIWTRGSTYYINWTSVGTISNILIELYLDGVYLMDISPGTPNDGEYSWIIPDTLNASTQYQIKITDSTHAIVYDLSDNFEIVLPSEGGIPGYNIAILVLSIVSISIVVLKKKFKPK